MRMTNTAKPQTLAALVNLYVAERRRRGEIGRDTARNQRSHLGGLVASFGARPIDQFGQAAIEQWQEAFGHLSPASRRGRLSTARMFCRWMVAKKLIRRDPTENIPSVRQPRSVPRALAGPSISALLGAVPDLRGEAIVWLMVGLGLRCCEVARLEVTDYDPGSGTVVVCGKGGNQRVLPVPSEPAAVLNRYLSSVGVVSGPLIRSMVRPWAGLRSNTIGELVGRWMANAGIKNRPWDGVSAHALRHTCASDVLDVCGDLRVVQELLGHAHLATTAIYLRRATAAQLRQAMEGRTYDTAA